MIDADWMTSRAAQTYPFTQRPVTAAGIELPNSFILDVHFNLPSSYQENVASGFQMVQLRDLGQSYSIIFSYQNINCVICQGISKSLGITESLSQRTYICSAMVTDPETLQQYPWMGAITGNLTAGATSQYTGGSTQFRANTGKLSSSCITFLVGQFLEAFKVNGVLLTGVVQLKPAQGIKISVGTADNVIKFQLDQNYLQALWLQKIAQYVQDNNLTSPITSINGIQPDSTGNINITGLDCVNIKGVSGGITIQNPCAKPCCDSNQAVTNIQSTLNLVQDQHKILREYFNNMANTVNYMQANLSTLMANR